MKLPLWAPINVDKDGDNWQFQHAYVILRGPKVKFVWGADHLIAFEQLNEIALSKTLLSYPTLKILFLLDTDASE